MADSVAHGALTAPKSAHPMRPGTRRRVVLVATVAVGGLLLYGAFLAVVTPKTVESVDASRPIGYSLVPDDDAKRPLGHLVTVNAWSNRAAGAVSVTLHFREGLDGPFQQARMQRIGSGNAYAAELPALAEGTRHFYYLSIRDALGNQVTVPESAPAAPLLHVRWEGDVNLAVLALHITLMIGALLFLVHSTHHAFLMRGRGREGRDPSPRSGLAAKAHRGIRWGWMCFFVGGIPLGIYVSGTALGWGNAWGGWPLGHDITDTKTELLIVYWAVVVALRPDLWLPRARLWRPLVGDRALARWILAGGVLTVAVYAIPHSFFFQ